MRRPKHLKQSSIVFDIAYVMSNKVEDWSSQNIWFSYGFTKKKNILASHKIEKKGILSKCRFDFVGEYFINKKSSDPKVLQINKKKVIAICYFCSWLFLIKQKTQKSAFATLRSRIEGYTRLLILRKISILPAVNWVPLLI